jgi:hypothetical protein
MKLQIAIVMLLFASSAHAQSSAPLASSPPEECAGKPDQTPCSRLSPPSCQLNDCTGLVCLAGQCRFSLGANGGELSACPGINTIATPSELLACHQDGTPCLGVSSHQPRGGVFVGVCSGGSCHLCE